uniref:Uncharacterized protein n=1 Tax=Timema monikensis TaxID=170555 RepID=A0A7R9HT05_9NEOP|nr:unnamed protein product [Timema monikensis]
MVGGRSKQISTSHLRLQDPKVVPVELSWEMVEQVMPAPMTSMTPTSDGQTPDPLIQPPPVDHHSRPASPAPEPFSRALSMMAPAKSSGRPAARLRDCLPPKQPRQTHRLGAPQIQERIRSRNATLDYYEIILCLNLLDCLGEFLLSLLYTGSSKHILVPTKQDNLTNSSNKGIKRARGQPNSPYFDKIGLTIYYGNEDK